MTCIPEHQRRLHVVAEAAALLLSVPLLVLVAKQRALGAPLRAAALGLAAGTLLVDGCLLARYAAQRETREAETAGAKAPTRPARG